jgi:hypothetical protein
MTKIAKPKARPFKKFYCDRDEVFLLPHPALKLWMFYYRLEGAKREGWACRETIATKCGMDKDVITGWRQWLVANGWLRKIGEHKTPNNPLASIPIMQVTRGTIPVMTNRRGKSAKSKANLKLRRLNHSVTDGSGVIQSPTVTERLGPAVTETIGRAATESFRRNVDQTHVDQTHVDQTHVDGPLSSDFSSDRKLKTEMRNGKKVVIGGLR